MKKEKKQNLTTAEIEKSLKDMREKLRVIKFGLAGGRTKNVKEVGNIRREVARMETAMTALRSAK